MPGAIFPTMAAARDRLLALARRTPAPVAFAAGCLAAGGALLAPGPLAGAGALAAAGPQHAGQQHSGTPTPQVLMRSRELWATIDVCNSPKQPNTVGIRGSMPGDGKPSDKLYMRFGLEYLDAVNQWAALPSSSRAGCSSGPVQRRPPERLELHPEAAPRARQVRPAGHGRLPLDAGRTPVRPRRAADDRRAQRAGGRRTGRVQRRPLLALIRPARTGGGRW